MDAFEPIINLLVLMTILSIAAERLVNVLKMGNPLLRKKAGDPRDREHKIARRVVFVSLGISIILKADLLQILSHLDAPWSTLGWAGQTPAQPGILFTTLGGCLLTGFSLGFGSKFWHDMLDVVSSLRTQVRS